MRSSVAKEGASTSAALTHAERFSLAHLKQLHAKLVANKEVNEKNQAEVVEVLRVIAEMVVYGDNKSEMLFDFFCEKNMLSLFLELMWCENGLPVKVHVQILQTLSILINCVHNDTSLYYLLSNNYINEVISFQHDFSADESLCDQYVSFIKSLSLRLNRQTVQFFFKTETGEFPLLTRAIDLLDFAEPMVRIAAQTTILNVYRVKERRAREYALQDEVMHKLFTKVVKIMEQQFFDAVKICKEHHKLIVELEASSSVIAGAKASSSIDSSATSSASSSSTSSSLPSSSSSSSSSSSGGEVSKSDALPSSRQTRRLEMQLVDLLTSTEDWLYYLQDIFGLQIMRLRRAFVHHLITEWVYPTILECLLQQWQGSELFGLGASAKSTFSTTATSATTSGSGGGGDGEIISPLTVDSPSSPLSSAKKIRSSGSEEEVGEGVVPAPLAASPSVEPSLSSILEESRKEEASFDALLSSSEPPSVEMLTQEEAAAVAAAAAAEEEAGVLSSSPASSSPRGNKDDALIGQVVAMLFLSQVVNIISDRMMQRAIITAMFHPLSRKGRKIAFEGEMSTPPPPPSTSALGASLRGMQFEKNPYRKAFLSLLTSGNSRLVLLASSFLNSISEASLSKILLNGRDAALDELRVMQVTSILPVYLDEQDTWKTTGASSSCEEIVAHSSSAPPGPVVVVAASDGEPTSVDEEAQWRKKEEEEEEEESASSFNLANGGGEAAAAKAGVEEKEDESEAKTRQGADTVVAPEESESVVAAAPQDEEVVVVKKRTRSQEEREEDEKEGEPDDLDATNVEMEEMFACETDVLSISKLTLLEKIMSSSCCGGGSSSSSSIKSEEDEVVFYLTKNIAAADRHSLVALQVAVQALYAFQRVAYFVASSSSTATTDIVDAAADREVSRPSSRLLDAVQVGYKAAATKLLERAQGPLSEQLSNLMQEELGRLRGRRWSVFGSKICNNPNLFFPLSAELVQSLGLEHQLPICQAEAARREVQIFIALRSLVMHIRSLCRGGGKSPSSDDVFVDATDSELLMFTEKGLMHNQPEEGIEFDMKSRKFLNAKLSHEEVASSASSSSSEGKKADAAASEAQLSSSLASFFGFGGGPRKSATATSTSSSSSSSSSTTTRPGILSPSRNRASSSVPSDVLFVQNDSFLLIVASETSLVAQEKFRVLVAVPLLHTEAIIDPSDKKRLQIVVRSWEAIKHMTQVGVPSPASTDAHHDTTTAAAADRNNNAFMKPQSLLSVRKQSTLWQMTLTFDADQACFLAAQHVEDRMQNLRTERIEYLRRLLRTVACSNDE